MIDLYCERTAAGLWAEPLNAVTNLGFLWVAVLTWRSRPDRGQREVRLLAALLGAIAIGSALFHTFATFWAQWLDVLPILLFQLAFLGLYLVRIAGMRRAGATAAVAVFLGLAISAAQFREPLNGSLGYLPALFVLGVLGFDAVRRAGEWRLACAAALFVLALCARTVDNALCAVWPWGTHFLWHLSNAGVLWLAIASYTALRQAK